MPKIKGVSCNYEIDEEAMRIGRLLEVRDQLLNQSSVTKDDIIESLAMQGRDYDRTSVQMTKDYELRVIKIISRVDSALKVEKSVWSEQINAIKQIDRLRFRLPGHLRFVINHIYYKKLTIDQAAERLGVTADKVILMIRDALTELSGLVR